MSMLKNCFKRMEAPDLPFDPIFIKRMFKIFVRLHNLRAGAIYYFFLQHNVVCLLKLNLLQG